MVVGKPPAFLLLLNPPSFNNPLDLNRSHPTALADPIGRSIPRMGIQIEKKNYQVDPNDHPIIRMGTEKEFCFLAGSLESKGEGSFPSKVFLEPSIPPPL